jgi:hypothetical protein
MPTLTSSRRSGIPVGFDWDDENQERALGRILAERKRPGDAWAARSRAIVRVARHRKKERQWNKIRVRIDAADRADVGIRMAAIELREIMDMLPYATSPDILKLIRETVDEAMTDGRKIRRAASLIRSVLKDKLKD